MCGVEEVTIQSSRMSINYILVVCVASLAEFAISMTESSPIVVSSNESETESFESLVKINSPKYRCVKRLCEF